MTLLLLAWISAGRCV